MCHGSLLGWGSNLPASDFVVGSDLDKWRIFYTTAVGHHGTPTRKWAAGGRIVGARDITFEDGEGPPFIGIVDGIRAEQSLSVRVLGILRQVVASQFFDNVAEVHHNQAVAEMIDDFKVMRNEHECELKFIFQILHQV